MMRSAAFVWAILAGAIWARGEENWAQFRGPQGQGTSDAKGLVARINEGENVRWKTEVRGKAWSSPVVWGRQVWVTTATEDGKELFAICLDRESGKVIHDLKLFDVPQPQYCHPYNSYASPTPAIEQGRIYVTFGSPGTACVDTATGKVVWERRDFQCNHYRGAASSPVLHRDLVLMHFDGSDFQYVVALNKNTGQTAWQTRRSVDFKDLDADGRPMTEGDFRKAFSTPVVVSLGGKDVMLSLGSKCLYAYDPNTGNELWRVEHHGCHSGSPIPIVGKDMAYVCMGLSRGELWAIRLDPNASGMVAQSHVAWKVTRDVPTRCSPVLVADWLYMVSDEGMISCLDARTGAEIWRKRLRGVFSASPLSVDGRIYFFSEAGATTVIEPGREFKLISEGKMSTGFMASAAVAGNALFVRTKGAVYRIEE